MYGLSMQYIMLYTFKACRGVGLVSYTDMTTGVGANGLLGGLIAHVTRGMGVWFDS